MTDKKDLYCLNAQTPEQSLSLIKQRCSEQITFRGYIVPGGPDAAIEISTSGVRAFLNTAPASPAGNFSRFVENYREPLFRAAAQLCNAQADTIVLVGRWLAAEFDAEPFFDPFLIHTITDTFKFSTRFYDLDIFDTDGLKGGSGFAINVQPPYTSAAAVLRVATEIHTNKDDGRANCDGTSMFDAVIWVPEVPAAAQLPPLYIRAIGKGASMRQERQAETSRGSVETARLHVFEEALQALKAELDIAASGSVSEPLRARFADLLAALHEIDDADDQEERRPAIIDLLKSTSFGAFRACLVSRTDRPACLTLQEIFESTDIKGYWSQIRSEANEAVLSTRYQRLPLEKLNHASAKAPLHFVGSNSDVAALGREYASDWEEMGNGYWMRVLAGGPEPQLPNS